MFGVIEITKRRKDLYVYSDLSAAIACFSRINKNIDGRILPNLNNSLCLLSKQDHIYNTSLDKYNLPISNILNIAIIRDKNLICDLGSVLLSLDKEQIECLSSTYNVEYIKYNEKHCKLCDMNFKIWSNDNCGYAGCSYNPLYFEIITLDNLRDYHISGYQDKIDKKIQELNLGKSKVFYFNINGPYRGLYLSKIPIPDNLNPNDFICCSCMDSIKDDFICIWVH